MPFWPFTLFKKKRPSLSSDNEVATFIEQLIPSREDYLGSAAQIGNAAKLAIRESRYEDAWRLLHEQKAVYLSHAKQYGMTRQQTVALDASVHEELADIRRREGNHEDALAHLLYSVLNSPRPTQAQVKKVGAYARRAGLNESLSRATVSELQQHIGRELSLRAVQSAVLRWTTK